MQPRMFSSKLKFSSATAKLFYLERFAIYGMLETEVSSDVATYVGLLFVEDAC